MYISEIVKGGLAEQDGRLLQGDQILNVCGQDVSAKLQEDVATLLKVCLSLSKLFKFCCF